MADAPQPHLSHRQGTWPVPAVALAVLVLGFGLQAVWRPLTALGCLQPRQLAGLPGIFLTPLLHGSMGHLVNNLVGRLPSLWLLVELYPRRWHWVMAWAWLATGWLVWLAAPAGCIIGASGVVYALLLFLLTGGLLGRDRQRWALAALLLFVNQGFVWGFLPLDPNVSWQSHVVGAMVGVALAFGYRTEPLAGQPAPLADDSTLPPEVWDYHRHLPGSDDNSPANE